MDFGELFLASVTYGGFIRILEVGRLVYASHLDTFVHAKAHPHGWLLLIVLRDPHCKITLYERVCKVDHLWTRSL